MINNKAYNAVRHLKEKELLYIYINEHLLKKFQEQRKLLLPAYKEAKKNKKKIMWKTMNGNYTLWHAWATYGPWAKSSPPRLLIRPANKFSRAVGLCNISIFIYFI